MAIIATRDNFTRNRKDRKTRKISGIEDVPKTRAQNMMKNLISSRPNPKLASGSKIKRDEGVERSNEEGLPKEESGQILGAI